MVQRGLFATLLAFFLVISVVGQTVRYEDRISGFLLSPAHSAIDASVKAPLPDLKNEETGTIILVTGDFHNSDVLIVAGKEKLETNQLLKNGKELASTLQLPQTNFIVAQGRRLKYLDLEFNAYVQKTQTTSFSSVPLGRIVSEVAKWNLPQPICIVVDYDKSFKTSVAGQVIKEITVLLPNEIKDGETVTLHVERHWYGLLALIYFGGFLLSIFIYLPVVMLRVIRRPSGKEDMPAPAQPGTLDETQERYTQSSQELRKQLKVRHFILPVATLLLFAAMPFMEDGFLWIPAGFNSRLLLLFPILLFIPLLLVAIYRRRKKDESDPNLSHGIFKRLSLFLLPVAFGFILLTTLIVFPQALRWVPTKLLRPAIFTITFVPIVVGALLTYRASRKNRVRLAAGDPDYDAAMEFAKKAKVHVSRVEINKDFLGVNAAASIFGRVFVTEGLREKLSQEERRAIIAHEIGHIKGQHVPIFMLLGFVFIAVIIFGAHELRDIAKNGPSWLISILDSPMIIWIPQIFFSALVLSPLRRRAELFADRFALTQTQNYSLVATALAKVHLFNGSPHTLTARHEKIASHPSLTKRLDSLRKVAQSLGLPIDDSEVEALFHGPTPSEDEPAQST